VIDVWFMFSVTRRHTRRLLLLRSTTSVID